MPLTMRGSVSARLSVRFSHVSAARKASRSLAKTSMPPGSSRGRRLFAANDVQRGAAFGAGFGQHQRAVGEIERGEVVAAAEFRPAAAPVQPAGDHEMQHQPQIAIEADGDALADSAQFAHDATFDRGERRIGGAQQEDVRYANALERLADDARFERAEVSGNVGKLRHGARAIRQIARRHRQAQLRVRAGTQRELNRSGRAREASRRRCSCPFRPASSMRRASVLRARHPQRDRRAKRARHE